MKPVFDKSADLIESRTKSGRGGLLDIGCGYGFFLQEMKCRGWKVEGIEVSEVGRQFVREKWGTHVYSQPLEGLALSENLFDVVTLFYVVEHVDDPLALLKEVNRILKPGGLVFLNFGQLKSEGFDKPFEAQDAICEGSLDQLHTGQTIMWVKSVALPSWREDIIEALEQERGLGPVATIREI